MRGNKAGFTLSETLTAVLLLAIVFGAVSGGVVMLRNSYEAITVRANAQTLLSTAVTQISADLHSAQSSLVYQGNTYYYCADRGIAIRYEYDTAEQVIAYNGTVMQKDTLVTGRTETDRLSLKIENLSYDTAGNLFTMKVSVYEKGKTSPIESTDLKIRPYVPVTAASGS